MFAAQCYNSEGGQAYIHARVLGIGVASVSATAILFAGVLGVCLRLYAAPSAAWANFHLRKAASPGAVFV